MPRYTERRFTNKAKVQASLQAGHSAQHSPQTKIIKQWANDKQDWLYHRGPAPTVLLGGQNSGKSVACVLKMLTLLQQYPGSRGAVIRRANIQLTKTTMETWFQWCAPGFYRPNGGFNQNAGVLDFNNGSRVYFLHLDQADSLDVLKGLDLNFAYVSQVEEISESAWDLLDVRCGRWTGATIPDEVYAAYPGGRAAWPWKSEEGDINVPPRYIFAEGYVTDETHWLYKRFADKSNYPGSTESPERAKWRAAGYECKIVNSDENRFAIKAVTQALLSKDEDYVRRLVRPKWGNPEGAIFTISPLSELQPTPALLNRLRLFCRWHWSMDHGDTAPTCVLWFAIDGDGRIFCVSPETRVLTEDLRYVEAGSVRPGDRLQGFDENVPRGRRQHRVGTVESVTRLRKPGYRLTMSDGTVLTCSADHQWLTRVRGGCNFRWLRTDALASDDYSPVRRGPKTVQGDRIVKLFDTWSEDCSRDGGYLAGFLDGEGSVDTSQHRTVVSFGQKRGVVLDEVLRILEARGFRPGVYNTKQDNFVNASITKRSEVARLLGSVRPKRLLSKMQIRGQVYASQEARVVKIEALGEIEVVAIQTTTRTFIAEGFASHNCVREYYVANALVTQHRKALFELRKDDPPYHSEYADPTIFSKSRGRTATSRPEWSVADEWRDPRIGDPRTTIAWRPAVTNDELATRSRTKEYLAIDPNVRHPLTNELGAPRLYFILATPDYPNGCNMVLKEIRAQRRKIVVVTGDVKVFSDERDDTIVDHSYDACVAPSTRVLRADLHYVPAGTIRLGDRLLGFDRDGTKQNPRQWHVAVVDAVKRLMSPSYRLMLSDGTVLECAFNHEWFTQSIYQGKPQWRTTESLLKPEHGWKLNHPRYSARGLVRVLPLWQLDDSRGAGYLAGVFDGEGSVTRAQLSFAQKNNALLRAAQAELAARGFDFGVYPQGPVWSVVIRGGLAERLRLLGSIRPERLLERLSLDLGRVEQLATLRVIKAELLGLQEVIAIQTNIGTYIAEGLLSANCKYHLIGRPGVAPAEAPPPTPPGQIAIKDYEEAGAAARRRRGREARMKGGTKSFRYGF